jgi:hypothetical protein
MSDRIAVAFEIVDHGIQHSDYFSGCGTSFTNYTDVATGIGDDFQEALEDALESLAQSGWNVNIVVDDEDHEDGESVSTIRENEAEERQQAWEDEHGEDEEYEDDECDDEDNRYYTVSVRVREFDPKHDEKHMKYVGKAIGRLDELATKIHNAQCAAAIESDKLEDFRKERDRLERYLEGREITLSAQWDALKR